MEYELQTYHECCENIQLFERWEFNISRNGRFVHYYDNDPKGFIWLLDGMLHRFDGPARIYCGNTKEWYFLGEYASVDTRVKFEKLIIDKMRSI